MPASLKPSQGIGSLFANSNLKFFFDFVIDEIFKVEHKLKYKISTLFFIYKSFFLKKKKKKSWG